MALALFLTCSVFAAEKDIPVKLLTFKEFYQKVLAYYPKLKQQNADVNSAIAAKLQAVTGFLPRVQGSFDVTQGNDPVYVFGSLLRENAFTQNDFALSKLNTPSSHTTNTFAITGQMPIFDAFQTISRVHAAKLKIASARDEEAFTRMEAFLVAAQAYLQAIAVEKIALVVNATHDAGEGDIRQAQELKDKGLILGADFYAARMIEGNIAQLKNQLVQEKQAVEIMLNILMGEDLLKPVAIDSDFSKSSLVIQPLQAWLDQAFKMRPDFAAVDKAIAAQTIEIKREKSTVLPTIDAFGEAREDTHRLGSSGGKNYTVGIKAQMDFFDPAHPARMRIAKEELKKLEADKAALKDMIAKDLVNEYARYMTISSNLPLAGNILDDAKQAADFMLPLHREGKKSIADLLQIRWAYLNAVRDYYSLAGDEKASQTRLLFLSGQLDGTRLEEAVKIIGE